MAQDIQAILRDGVDAARRGDKLAARRLLQQVLIQDRSNEVALMWMASVVDTLEDRRAYLQMALQVNPRNERAREALKRLGGDPSAASTPRRTAEPGSAGSMPPIQLRRVRSAGLNPFFIGAAIVAVVLVAIVVFNANNPTVGVPRTSTAFVAANATRLVSPSPTVDPALTLTPTEFYGLIVTLDPAVAVLPPTFTPPPTEVPSATPSPTETPVPPGDYAAFSAEYVDAAAEPALFRGLASGSDTQQVADGGFSDIALSADGTRLAFIRLVYADAPSSDAEATPEAGSGVGLPQLFVAAVDDLANPRQLTNMGGAQMSHPSWSPDGTQLVFASDQDGDFELYTISADGGETPRLTDNEIDDITPAYAPDGAGIVFASDIDSPGFYELYRYTPGVRAPERLTDTAGSSYGPAFSPDGSQIAFINDQGGDPDIFVANAEGERYVQLTIDDGGAEDRNPVWTPDGRYIAFASNRDGDHFGWYAVTPRGTVTRLADNNRDAQSLTFIP